MSITESLCKRCGKPVIQQAGKRKREYCNDVCRQLAYRDRKRQQAPQQTQPESEQMQTRAFLEERETRYRQDTADHLFKRWLSRQHRPGDIEFVRRLLSDDRLPSHGSRAHYIGSLRLHGYAKEEIYHFEEIWKDMLFSQSQRQVHD